MKMNVPEPKKGLKTDIIRFYFYFTEGLDFFNPSRYFIAVILAIYGLLHLNSFWYIPIMFVVGCAVLICFGWLNVNHMKKTIEFFTIKRATTYGKYGYELQEQQLDKLEEILNVLKNDKLEDAKKKEV